MADQWEYQQATFQVLGDVNREHIDIEDLTDMFGAEGWEVAAAVPLTLSRFVHPIDADKEPELIPDMYMTRRVIVLFKRRKP